MFSDNGDGSRSFVRAPSEAMVGEHEFVFEAFDAVDVTLFSSQTLRVNVLDSLSYESNNFPPEIESLNDQQITLGESFDFRVIPIYPEGVVPSLRVDRLPPNAGFNDNFDGSRTFKWFPYPTNVGGTFVTFVAIDA